MEPVDKLSTNSFFNKTGYLYIKNILTENDCHRLANIMLRQKEEGLLGYDGRDGSGRPSQFYANSFGGNTPEFEKELITIQPRIEEEIGVKLTPVNSYARIYYNGGILNKHVDRKNLDYTLSITLYSNLDNDWPLWCTDLNGNDVPLVVHRGDGGLMLGTKLTHWREPLICKDDQYVIQLFLHWSK